MFSYFHAVLNFADLGSERDVFLALQRQSCKEVHEMLIEINEDCKNCRENAYSNFMLKTGLHLFAVVFSP